VITCFVASAFDRNDVDAIYDKVIRLVLRDLKIRCTRVDRVEHNDDIDDKIFSLMNAADFCIADLTYARPSVYYEAGYMFGHRKPVVYITRADHFRAKDSDSYGNLKIHFDLQMKNIISWTEPNRTFATRLRRRITQVVAPLLKATKEQEEKLRHQEAFTNEAISTQLALLRRFAGQMLRARGFSEISEPSREPHRPSRLLAVTRDRSSHHEALNFLPLERLTKSQTLPEWALSFYTPGRNPKARQIERLFVYATLTNINETTVRSIFHRFTPVEKYLLERRLNPSPLDTWQDPPTIVRIGVLPSIRSVSEFQGRFRALLDKVNF
jgi:nucleoside 2-deoxyribosyltransferase